MRFEGSGSMLLSGARESGSYATDRPGDRVMPLSDPPCGIGAELKSLPVLVPLGRFHQSDIALLYQVQKREPASSVMLRYIHDQPQVAAD